MRIRRVTVCELGGASLSLPETEVFSSTAPLKYQSLWLPELQGRGSLKFMAGVSSVGFRILVGCYMTLDRILFLLHRSRLIIANSMFFDGA